MPTILKLLLRFLLVPLFSLALCGQDTEFAEFRKLEAYYTEVGVPLKLEVETTNDEIPLTSVEFFVDDILIGNDQTVPFSVMWTPNTISEHIVVAKAINAEGSQSTVSITTQPTFYPTTSLLDDRHFLHNEGDLISFKDKLYLLSASQRRIYESADGTTWSPSLTAAFPLHPFSIATANGLIFVNSESGVYFSEDGAYWYQNPITNTGGLYDAKAVGKYFIAKRESPTDDMFSISEDLRNWVNLPPFPDVNAYYEFKPWLNDSFAVSSGNSAENLYFLNENLSWEKASLPDYVESINGAAIDKNTSTVYLQINRSKSHNFTRLIKSKDGLNWDIVELPPDYLGLDDFIYKENVLIINYFGSRATSFFSFDQGGSWVKSPFTSITTDITGYKDGFLIAQNGLFFTKDGINFSESAGDAEYFTRNADEVYCWLEPAIYRYAPIYRYTENQALEQLTGEEFIGYLSGFCRGESGFVAIGENSVAVSRDTLNWQTYEKPNSDMNGSVVYGNGRYVADLDAFSNKAKGYAVSTDALSWDFYYQEEEISRVFSRVQYLPAIRKFVRLRTPNQIIYISDDAVNWQPSLNPIPNASSMVKLKVFGDYLWAWYRDKDSLEIRLAYTKDLVTWNFRKNGGYSDVEYANGMYALYEFSKDSQILMPNGLWVTPDLPNPRLKSTANGFLAQSTTDWVEFKYYYSKDGTNWSEIENPVDWIAHPFAFVDEELYILGERLFHLSYEEFPAIKIEKQAEQIKIVAKTAKLDPSSIQQSSNLSDWYPVDLQSEGRHRDVFHFEYAPADLDTPIFFKIFPPE